MNTILGGFKHCNVASTNHSKSIVKYESTNPFYLGEGLACNMTVPKDCRLVPTTHLEALPLTTKGRCLADPKTTDITKFCEKTVINHKKISKFYFQFFSFHSVPDPYHTRTYI